MAGYYQFLSDITAPVPISSGQFARSLSMSRDGNWLAVSSRTISGYASIAGGVQIFSRNGNTWAYHSVIPPDPFGVDTYFGFGYNGVSINGDGTLLAIADDMWNTNTGRIIVASRSGTIWSLHSVISNPEGLPNQYFGEWITMNYDGTRLCTIGDQKKTLYTFSRTGTTWSVDGSTVSFPTGGWSSAEYNLSLSSSGDKLLVGDCYFDAGATGRAVYLTRSGSSWTQLYAFQAPIPAAYRIFGRAVALNENGNYAVVYEETAYGVVYLYELTDSEATLLATIDPPVAQSELFFGWALALNTNPGSMVAGSLSDDPLLNMGRAYTYSIDAEFVPFWTEYKKSDEFDVPYT